MEKVKVRLAITKQAPPKMTSDGRKLIPVNVCTMGTASTITAHEGGRCLANMLTQGHYPITGVLITYGPPIKF